MRIMIDNVPTLDEAAQQRLGQNILKLMHFQQIKVDGIEIVFLEWHPNGEEK